MAAALADVPRSLIAAMVLSLVIGAVGYFRFRLAAEQLALIAAGLCALGGVLNILYTLVFPRSLAERARYFESSSVCASASRPLSS